MDFDSIITFLFILAFFVLPSILKQVQARKKKNAKQKKTKKNFSIFDRIGERIRQFVQELEEQRRQQEQTGKDPGKGTIWETLAEDEAPLPAMEPEDVDVVETEAQGFKPPIIKPSQRRKPVLGPSLEPQVFQVPSESEKYGLRSDPLQNAIVWSEILSKPLALRKK